MTLKEARKILGEKAKNVSDEDLQRDIDTAQLLKELFFDEMLNRYKTHKAKTTR